MIANIHPALLFIFGSLLIPFLRGRLKTAYVVLLPIVGFFNFINLPFGQLITAPFLNFELILLNVDKLNFVFGLIFHIITLIAIIYVLNFNKTTDYMAGFFYAGSALGVVFSGDFFSFFVFWEMLTLGAMYFILAGKSKKALGSAYRYALFHVVGGLIFLTGILLHIHETGSIAVQQLGLNGIGSILIFIGFGVNSAWPFLHTWLVDSYPESSIGGAVFLGAFTTKAAVYALVRVFPGEDLLIWIGLAMAIYTLFFAVIENDVRRALSYTLINQLGFLMVGIGIGTHLSINGTVAHIFVHILYKSLLFMSIGAVMYRTGKSRYTDLGGLYKYMPLTCLFTLIASLSMTGFVTKSMIMSAALYKHYYVVWIILLFAAVGVFHAAGIKVPFFTFFSRDSKLKAKEAPLNMLIAMGATAILSLLILIFPNALYKVLPYATKYAPYTVDHVISEAQLLVFSGLAFILMLRAGVYPAEKRSVNLDVDVIYRKFFSGLSCIASALLNPLNTATDALFRGRIVKAIGAASKKGPAVITTALLRPVWDISNLSERQQKTEAKEVEKRLFLGSYPISASALLVLAFLAAFLLVS